MKYNLVETWTKRNPKRNVCRFKTVGFCTLVTSSCFQYCNFMAHLVSLRFCWKIDSRHLDNGTVEAHRHLYTHDIPIKDFINKGSIDLLQLSSHSLHTSIPSGFLMSNCSWDLCLSSESNCCWYHWNTILEHCTIKLRCCPYKVQMSMLKWGSMKW